MNDKELKNIKFIREWNFDPYKEINTLDKEGLSKKDKEIVSKFSLKLLTSKEKNYLKNVLMPYKDRIIYIKKQTIGRNWAEINIKLESIIAEKLYDMISLPVFEKDKYYKNLVNDKPYTKEELELFKE